MRALSASEGETLELLSRLVAVRSVFPQEAAVAHVISAYLTERGFRVDVVETAPGRPNLVATFGQSERYLGFYGHMDTVPPAEDYARDPFTVVRDGDIVRGLGVCDMKGGLTCILRAVGDAAARGLPVKAVFGVDEEDISRGAHDLVQSGKLADIGFLIVAESGQVENFSQPLSVCLGRKGRIVLQLDVGGRTAHAAESHKGINAIEQAAALITALATLPRPAHPRLGHSTVVVQQISAQAGAFSVPDRCTVVLSVLTTPGVTSADFAESIAACAARVGVEVTIVPQARPTPYGEAYELDTSDPFYRIVSREVLAPLGVTPIYTPSVADENVFAHRLAIPVLTIGVIGGGDHTKDEWSSLASFERVIGAYARAIELWNSSPAPPL